MTPPVAYPGPPGTHTAAAAVALFPSGPHVPLGGFRAVAEAVVSAEVAFGVLPIESSLAGAVAETHDLLYERSLSIVGETILQIRHQLAGPADVPLEEIRLVRSHPTALEQCRSLLARLPNAQVVSTATTAEAARQAAEEADPDRRRDRRRGGRPPVRPARARRRRGRRHGVHALRLDRPAHAGRGRAAGRPHRVHVRHRPPPGRALRGDRAVRPGRASTSSASSRGRCRRRRGGTASTRSWRGTRSIRPSVSRFASYGTRPPRSAWSASTKDTRR